MYVPYILIDSLINSVFCVSSGEIESVISELVLSVSSSLLESLNFTPQLEQNFALLTLSSPQLEHSKVSTSSSSLPPIIVPHSEQNFAFVFIFAPQFVHFTSSFPSLLLLHPTKDNNKIKHKLITNIFLISIPPKDKYKKCADRSQRTKNANPESLN